MKDPFMAHLGLVVLHLAPGEVVVWGEAHLNLHGTAHGGFLSRRTATYEVEVQTAEK
jgi:acyl-CoA thioesterase